MKRLLILSLVLFACGSLFAQNTAKEKIESARIALITERLGLTPDQAEKFWPLYNEYRDLTQQLRQEYETAKEKLNPQSATDEEKRNLLNLGLRLKEQKVELEKDYSQRMMRVISAQQIMSLRKAEDDFRRMLLEQIQKRRLQEGRRNQIRDKIKERREGDGGL